MATAGEYFDALETRDPASREAALMTALRRQVAHAKAATPYYGRLLASIDAAAVADRAALARLPLTRKSALIALQREDPPFGGLLAVPPGSLARIFGSPGPIYDPEGRRPDHWRFARALHAAGIRAGEIVHNSFSYHLTPAGAMIEAAAHRLGCAVIPAGTGQSELQARAIADLKPQAYLGTPSFLRILIEKARELGLGTLSLKRALVTGEAFPAALRREIAGHGIDALQCYGTADLGLVAYESSAREGMILDEEIILEIVRPGTGDLVPEGEVGEVVVTVLAPEYPLIRFATGDLSAILPGRSPCGRTNRRIRGWMGRADQTTKVKGMFVHPEQVAEIVKRHPEVIRARLEVTHDGRSDAMTLKVELVPAAGTGLVPRIAETLSALTKLKGEVLAVPPQSLANDGKVIADLRPPG